MELNNSQRNYWKFESSNINKNKNYYNLKIEYYYQLDTLKGKDGILFIIFK